MALHSPEGSAVAAVAVITFAAVGAEAVGFMDLAGAVGFTGLLPMDLAAAGFMGLLLTVAGLAWVMDGVAMR
jgi:hypothetical protein